MDRTEDEDVDHNDHETIARAMPSNMLANGTDNTVQPKQQRGVGGGRCDRKITSSVMEEKVRAGYRRRRGTTWHYNGAQHCEDRCDHNCGFSCDGSCDHNCYCAGHTFGPTERFNNINGEKNPGTCKACITGESIGDDYYDFTKGKKGDCLKERTPQCNCGKYWKGSNEYGSGVCTAVDDDHYAPCTGNQLEQIAFVDCTSNQYTTVTPSASVPPVCHNLRNCVAGEYVSAAPKELAGTSYYETQRVRTRPTSPPPPPESTYLCRRASVYASVSACLHLSIWVCYLHLLVFLSILHHTLHALPTAPSRNAVLAPE